MNKVTLTFTVDLGHRADEDSVSQFQRLQGFWSAVSKCSANIDNGTRLENMAWRMLSSAPSDNVIDKLRVFVTDLENSAATLSPPAAASPDPHQVSSPLTSVFSNIRKNLEENKAQYESSHRSANSSNHRSVASQKVAGIPTVLTRPSSSLAVAATSPTSRPAHTASTAPPTAATSPTASSSSAMPSRKSRPSLFFRSASSTNNQSQSSAGKRFHEVESSDDVSSSTDTDEDTDSDGYDADDDRHHPANTRTTTNNQDFASSSVDAGRLTQAHRNATSVVRGFDPQQSSVSVYSRSSFLNKPKISPLQPLKKANDNATGSSAAATGAKVTKPKSSMFYIESSPSDAELANSLSTNGSTHGPSQLESSKLKNSPSKAADEDINDDSDWDSVEDESDQLSEFDESDLYARDIEEANTKSQLKKPSLLSSLLLNKPEVLQQAYQLQNAQNAQHPQNANSLPKKMRAVGADNDALSSSLTNRRPPNRRQDSQQSARFTGTPPIATGSVGNIVGSHESFPVPMSPRTARRTMISQELSESVRKNMLAERQDVYLRSRSAANLSNLANTSSNNSTSSRRNAPALSRRDTLNNSSADDTDNESISASVNGLGSGGSGQEGMQLKRGFPSLVRMPRAQSSATLPNPSEEDEWKHEMEDSNNLDFNYHARGW